jgi:hypothetical protein
MERTGGMIRRKSTLNETTQNTICARPAMLRLPHVYRPGYICVAGPAVFSLATASAVAHGTRMALPCLTANS